jgi:hypothetical protein
MGSSDAIVRRPCPSPRARQSTPCCPLSACVMREMRCESLHPSNSLPKNYKKSFPLFPKKDGLSIFISFYGAAALFFFRASRQDEELLVPPFRSCVRDEMYLIRFAGACSYLHFQKVIHLGNSKTTNQAPLHPLTLSHPLPNGSFYPGYTAESRARSSLTVQAAGKKAMNTSYINLSPLRTQTPSHLSANPKL